MTVHFICRGNVFRSRIAETYLNSLELPGIHAISSGTVAESSRQANLENLEKTYELLQRHGLNATRQAAEQLTTERMHDNPIVVCVNQRAFDEASKLVHLPADSRIWDIDDIGEGNRLITATTTRESYEEEVFEEITQHVDQLAAELQKN